MQATWGELKLQVGRKVNDPQAAKMSATLLDCFNDALRLFAAVHTGAASTSDIVGDGVTTEYPIPDNMIETAESGSLVTVLNVTKSNWLERSVFVPGENELPDYHIWNSRLCFYRAPALDEQLRVYYSAYYPEVENDASVVNLPGWAFEAVKLYTAGRVLEDPVSQMSLLASFKTKVDSGNPEHNPLMRLSERYISEFWELINQHPTGKRDVYDH